MHMILISDIHLQFPVLELVSHAVLWSLVGRIRVHHTTTGTLKRESDLENRKDNL
jgi:hypothetical protein